MTLAQGIEELTYNTNCKGYVRSGHGEVIQLPNNSLVSPGSNKEVKLYLLPSEQQHSHCQRMQHTSHNPFYCIFFKTCSLLHLCSTKFISLFSPTPILHPSSHGTKNVLSCIILWNLFPFTSKINHKIKPTDKSTFNLSEEAHFIKEYVHNSLKMDAHLLPPTKVISRI